MKLLAGWDGPLRKEVPMRRAMLVGVSSLAMIACADQRLMGLAHGPAAVGSLIPVRIVQRCARDHGPRIAYLPFTVIDGRVYLPEDTAAVRALNPDAIEQIQVLKGEAAAARYGPIADTTGALVITTRRVRGASPRPAT